MVVLDGEAADKSVAQDENDVVVLEGQASHDDTMNVDRFRVAKAVEDESDAAIAALASSLYVARRLTPSQKDQLVTSLLACTSSPAFARSLFELFHLNRRLAMPDHAW